MKQSVYIADVGSIPTTSTNTGPSSAASGAPNMLLAGPPYGGEQVSTEWKKGCGGIRQVTTENVWGETHSVLILVVEQHKHKTPTSNRSRCRWLPKQQSESGVGASRTIGYSATGSPCLPYRGDIRYGSLRGVRIMDGLLLVMSIAGLTWFDSWYLRYRISHGKRL